VNVILKAVIVVGACIGLTGTVPEPVQAFACGKCDDCIGGHTNPFSQSDKESEGTHSGCIAVAGCPHADCIVTFQPSTAGIERVLADVEAGDVKAAKRLLRMYPTSIVWNQDRGALQMRAACSGDGFVAHIPLSEAQNRYLAEQ
jgi:hypothetical protein